jgi:cyclophilin family peptidyl-prolyl cis-trans isomerase/HEAT repeat protein
VTSWGHPINSMKAYLTGLVAIAMVACEPNTKPKEEQPAPASWVSDQLWQVIDAQDRRDTKALSELIHDQRAEVRARAALALASVGEKAAVPLLFNALSDDDPAVRANAAFAFGFCGDSVSVHQLIERYSSESAPAVRGRMAEAAGRCGGRAGADLLLRRSIESRADSLGVLRGLYFAAANGHTDTSHVRFALSMFTGKVPLLDETALQVCLRGRGDLLKSFVPKLLSFASPTMSTDVELPWLASLGKTGNKEVIPILVERAAKAPDPLVRVVALRALNRFGKEQSEVATWTALHDPSTMVRDQALEQMLAWRQAVDAASAWNVAQEHTDYRVKIPLYGLVMKYGDPDTRRMCGMLLKSTSQQDPGPYINAMLIKAMASEAARDTAIWLTDAMLKRSRAVERMAAFEAREAIIAEFAKHADATNAMLYGRLMNDALSSGDAGLIAAACERLVEWQPSDLKHVLNDTIVQQARSKLAPIADLEAIQNLDACVAQRDGQPKPEHKGPPFNHPIDRARLGALDPRQRYRIRTELGEIVIAIEADAAPGSCLAFDSLVTAGYYNGKYFHRVVPDFVAQGGCPRGDGYGSMDWTLRSEFGLEGFTTGAIGLASAGKDTESCQFFFMLAHAPHLDGRYTRFAHVESGMEIVWQLRIGDVMQTVERMK